MRALCPAESVKEGQARGMALGADGYIIVRENNQFYLYRNRCPHIGVPLEWQPDDFIDAETGLLRCATHGALFLPANGECVSGPCAGQSLQAVPFRLENGTIYLTD